jgi:hypothetical protein
MAWEVPLEIRELTPREQQYVEPRVLEREMIANELVPGAPGGKKVNRLRQRLRILERQLSAFILLTLDLHGARWIDKTGKPRSILCVGKVTID